MSFDFSSVLSFQSPPGSTMMVRRTKANMAKMAQHSATRRAKSSRVRPCAHGDHSGGSPRLACAQPPHTSASFASTTPRYVMPVSLHSTAAVMA
jgi:hypothetical protein